MGSNYTDRDLAEMCAPAHSQDNMSAKVWEICKRITAAIATQTNPAYSEEEAKKSGGDILKCTRCRRWRHVDYLKYVDHPENRRCFVGMYCLSEKDEFAIKKL